MEPPCWELGGLRACLRRTEEVDGTGACGGADLTWGALQRPSGEGAGTPGAVRRRDEEGTGRGRAAGRGVELV